MSVWHSAFYGGIAESDFGIDVAQLGLLTSYAGALGMLTQLSGLIKFTSTRFSDRTINMCVGLLLAAVFIFMTPPTGFRESEMTVLGYKTNLATLLLMALLVPITACFTLVRSLSTAQFTKSVPADKAGTIIGVDMGIGSAVRIVSPLIGGRVQAAHGLYGVAGLCSGLYLLMAVLSGLLMGKLEAKQRQKSR